MLQVGWLVLVLVALTAIAAQRDSSLVGLQCAHPSAAALTMLHSMLYSDVLQEESIVTADIEAKTAAARSAEAGSSSRHPSRQRVQSHSSFLDSSFDAFESEFGHMSVLDGRMRPPKPPGTPSTSTSGSGKLDKSGSGRQGSGWAGGADAQAAGQAGSGDAVGADGEQQQQEGGEGQEEDQQEQEQETLHRLCPTYASDINSPLRHVRTRIYFTSESHIHSLVNVMRYCHLICPGASSSALTSYSTPAGGMSKAPSAVSVPGIAAAAAAATAGGSSVAVATAGGSGAVAAAAASGSGTAAAAAVQPGGDGAAAPALIAAAAAAAMAKAKGTAFASPAAAAVAAAGGAAAVADGSSGSEVLVGTSSVSSTTGPQQLLTPEGQALLASTDEFDYLTHIVFRMYENKTVSRSTVHR